MMANIKRDIETAYGSLEKPDWSFVAKRMRDGLYDELVKKLDDIGSIQETTDQNDDSSRCLFIAAGTQSLTLRLSMVGKYACVHEANGQFLSESDMLKNEFSIKLFKLLTASEIRFLDGLTLRTEVQLGGKKHALYEVLFSDDGLIS